MPGIQPTVSHIDHYVRGKTCLSYFLVKLLFFCMGAQEAGVVLRACKRITFVCPRVSAPETALSPGALTPNNTGF